jgi:hypothetical protein
MGTCAGMEAVRIAMKPTISAAFLKKRIRFIVSYHSNRDASLFEGISALTGEKTS